MTTDSRVRTGMVFGALALGILIGVWAGFVLDKGSASPPTTGDSPVVGPGPTDEENGVPVGYSHTEEGAVAAATNFSLLTTRDDLLDVNALTTAMETLAAPDWKDDAATQAMNGNEFIVDRYGDDADLSGSVLRYDVVDYSPDRAVIRLWTVSVASGSKRPNVEEVWGTLTITLVWSDGDWRVEGNESTPGPAPIDLPAGQPEQSASSLMEDFHEFVGAPIP